MNTRNNLLIIPRIDCGNTFHTHLSTTTKMVVKEIRDMKDDKSPEVDGIPPKLLLEIVEQISLPFATVFNLSLEEGNKRTSSH